MSLPDARPDVGARMVPAGIVVGTAMSLVPVVACLASLAGGVAGLALVAAGLGSVGRQAWVPVAIVAVIARITLRRRRTAT